MVKVERTSRALALARCAEGGVSMNGRHNFIPHGVIPAVILPFNDDYSIDEANFRRHLRDVASVQGLSAVTVNAHSTEVS